MAKKTAKNVDEKQTEEKILAAAQRVFVRRGIAGARTEEIAKEAGVNRALINYYFRSREKLAEAVFARVATSLFPPLMKTLGSDLPLRKKLQEVIDLELTQLSANPFLPLYVLAELQYHPEKLKKLIAQIVPIHQLQEQVLSKLQNQLDEEAEAGRLIPVLAKDLMVMLMSLLIFPFAASTMIETMIGLDERERQEMLARRRSDLADFILKGLGAQ